MAETKDAGESYPLFGVTSFAELDQLQSVQDATEQMDSMIENYKAIISNIMLDPAIPDKAGAITALTSEFTARLADANKPKERTGFIDKIKALLGKKTVTRADPLPTLDHPSFTVWKDQGGGYRWLAIYSNQFRDKDNPPEIISEKSHKAFTSLVDDGTLAYPELWHWHTPGTTWGKADWLDYADGFALASGYILPGHEKEAEALSQMNDIRVSHGMPSRMIVRNKQDPSIIDFHVTTEISDLPGYAAANPLTEFAVFTKEFDMALSPEKRNYLAQVGLDNEQINAIESNLAAKGKAAQDAGIEAKEADAPISETPAAVETPVADAPQYATVQEVADTIAGIMKPVTDALTAINAQLANVNADMKALKEADESKIAKAASAAPRASLQELIAANIIGSSAAQIDGRTALAKAGPKEAQSQSQITGVPFLDSLIHQAQGSVQ